MSKNVKIAITQMNVAPDAVDQRLNRAEELVRNAAKQGAELVVLPELFNTGYAYEENNFIAARKHNHRTERWMQEISAQFNVHLAGSFLHYDQQIIFNSLHFMSPDGKTWRYDKNFPWGWERTYFEAGNDIQIADTDLGRIGFMLCWDVAHPNLWQKYAGKVDLILASTCPPNIPDAVYHLPDGNHYQAGELGPLFAKMQHSAKNIFIDTPAQQCAWLGVPYISSTGSGKVSTPIPNPMSFLIGAIFSKPGLVYHLSQADNCSIDAEMVEAGLIYSANGQLLNQLRNTNQDEFCIADVEIKANTESPTSNQPKPSISEQVYFISDWYLPVVNKGTYRRELRNMNKM